VRALAHAIDPVSWARDALGFNAEAWQGRVLRSLAPRVALNCSRQAGKSTIAAALALHTAQHRPGSLVLVAAPSLRQSSELYRKVHAFIAHLAAPPELAEQNASTITLANGSRLVCIPTSEATLRGFSAPTLVILDEASRIEDEAVEAIRPMLANGRGRMLMMSTPNGQRGAFFEAWTTQRIDWEWHEVPATQIPRISPAFLEQERRAMGPRVFAREYECAFTETDGALFELDQIAACMTDNVQPLFGPNGSLAARQLTGLLSSAVRPLALA
jgi:hypothetical protein